MTRATTAWLKDQLTDRDLELLAAVEQYRLITTKQLERLLFDDRHPTGMAATRACNRVLQRLRQHRLLATLERRIGGARAGSAGFVWYLGPAGDRLLRSLSTVGSAGRRNYREPSRHFVDHTLAIAELAIQAVEASRTVPGLDVAGIDTEPRSWQQSLSPYGTTQWLKPDLRLVIQTNKEELHYFVEADQGTEHLPVIRRQCAAYVSFFQSGRYQAAHGVFPTVVWVAPNPQRAAAIERAADHVTPALFRACAVAEYGQLLQDDAAEGSADVEAEAGPQGGSRL